MKPEEKVSATTRKKNTFENIDPERVSSKLEMNKLNKSMMNAMGLDCIREGKCAVILLAGGQDAKLEYEHPKGMYNIGLPSGKSIFQLLVEKFFKAQLLAHEVEADTIETPAGRFVKIPEEIQRCKMLILTNRNNHTEIVEFFE